MASPRRMVLVLALSLAVFLSTSQDDEFEFDSFSTGRNLLQILKNCTVDFEHLNYTIVTSQCKGPNYPLKQCCTAFVQLACPYANELNDEASTCALTLFSYLSNVGRYPPGLFANGCKDSKRGLECNSFPNPSTSAAAVTADRAIVAAATGALLLVMVFAGSVMATSSSLS